MGVRAKLRMQIPENKWDFVASCIKIGISTKRGAADWSRLICGWTSFVGEFWAFTQTNCMIVNTALILDTGKLQNSLKTAVLHEDFSWLICVVVLFTQTIAQKHHKTQTNQLFSGYFFQFTYVHNC